MRIVKYNKTQFRQTIEYFLHTCVEHNLEFKQLSDSCLETTNFMQFLDKFYWKKVYFLVIQSILQCRL